MTRRPPFLLDRAGARGATHRQGPTVPLGGPRL